MSTPKDYALEVSPAAQDQDSGLIKFTVKSPLSLFHYVKLPVALAIIAALVAVLTYDMPSVDAWKGTWGRLDGTNNTLPLFVNHTFGPATENQRWYAAAVLVILLGILLCKRQQQDSMTVIRDVGIQLDSVLSWWFTNSSDKSVFIPLKDIMDIVINEGFHGYGQVIFYMCILRRSQSDDLEEKPLKIVFPQLLPRKDILLQVWKQSRQVLFGTSRRYWRRVPGHGLRECSMEDLTTEQ